MLPTTKAPIFDAGTQDLYSTLQRSGLQPRHCPCSSREGGASASPSPRLDTGTGTGRGARNRRSVPLPVRCRSPRPRPASPAQPPRGAVGGRPSTAPHPPAGGAAEAARGGAERGGGAAPPRVGAEWGGRRQRRFVLPTHTDTLSAAGREPATWPGRRRGCPPPRCPDSAAGPGAASGAAPPPEHPRPPPAPGPGRRCAPLGR